MRIRRQNIRQDIKAPVPQMIQYHQYLLNVIPNLIEKKKHEIILESLNNLDSYGVKDLVDVTGIMKKHGYKGPEMKDFIFQFDKCIMSQDEKYEPNNPRVVSKGSQNVDNIFFTEFCVERDKKFIEFLKAKLESNVVEEIENAIKNEKEKIKNQFTNLDLNPWQTLEEDQSLDSDDTEIYNDFDFLIQNEL